MARILAYAELRDGSLRSVAAEVVSAARSLADELDGEVAAVVAGGPGAADAAGQLGRYGADLILVAERADLSQYNPDTVVELLTTVSSEVEPVAILLPASAQGKDLAARLAARLDVGLATEITEVRVEDGVPVVKRPVYGGKAYGTYRFAATPALMSLRPNVFRPGDRAGGGKVQAIDAPSVEVKTRVTGFERSEREALDVLEAGIVVSGGRGLQEHDNWRLLEDLVSALGDDATLGASRAVVDAGWRPHSEQVGQTGKVVSPSLYFAVGISGAIQHLAGMRTAGVIVAINKDAEAPIFGVANYGLVGDLFEIVPRLTDEINTARGSTG